MVGVHADTDTTGAVDPCVHAVTVCIGIDGAYRSPTRVAIGCVATCWVRTHCIGIGRVTAGCVAAGRVHTDCKGIDKASTV